MKKSITVLLVVVITLVSVNLFSQTTFKTETTINADKESNRIDVQRFLFNSAPLNVRYDFKLNRNGKTVNDLITVNVPKVIETKKFSLDLTGIKLGDKHSESEYFGDISAEIKIDSKSKFLCSFGAGFGPSQSPRIYGIGRYSLENVTLEAGVVSKKGFHNFDELTQDRYAWGAYHNEHIFVALGTEITRTWFLTGTKNFKDFGMFTLCDFDRASDDFWIRSQVGYKNANQAFFCQENYLVATSYLIVPPFPYLHFGPISTKAELLSFKVDISKKKANERIELIAGTQFGSIGQFALGFVGERITHQPILGGVSMEYFNSLTIGKFKASVELHYEPRTSKGSGFITTGYTL